MHAVIFDIDGTLLDSSEVDGRLYGQAVRDVLGDVHIRPGWGDYTHVTDSGILAEIAADNAIALTDAVAASVHDRFIALLDNHITGGGGFTAMPGALEFFERLQREPGYGTAIATGAWQASATMKLACCGFSPDNLILACSDSEPERTAIMTSALDRLGPDVSRVTYFGDGEWDRRASEALGWNFVAVGKELGGIVDFGRIEELFLK